jgi:hypothetical protein
MSAMLVKDISCPVFMLKLLIDAPFCGNRRGHIDV